MKSSNNDADDYDCDDSVYEENDTQLNVGVFN